jgi:transcriptional regulator with XRE-family HTH domain
MTIKELARLTGISISTLSRSLNGHREFKESEIKEIVRVLECSFEDLFSQNLVCVNDKKYFVSEDLAIQIEKLIKKSKQVKV